MYLLGAHLADQKLVRIALTSFYGISHTTARKLCARLQLHEAATVSSLTDTQVNSLSAYLSSPGSIPAQKPSPTAAILGVASSSSSNINHSSGRLPPSQRPAPSSDPLRSIVLESDLRRQLQSNIAHHRTIGTYRGRRHVQGLPVRGQRTRRNALTARRLNRVERRGMVTWAAGRQGQSSQQSSHPSISSLVGPLLALRFPS
ncbi:hypothetical protein CBS101457_000878 [Exobasidium rhododendri]|nr:hypothetical protein CBS101457_000878 [Exobasidium rhododendri]